MAILSLETFFSDSQTLCTMYIESGIENDVKNEYEVRYGCTGVSFRDTSSSEIFLCIPFYEVYFLKIMALPLTTSLAGLEAKAS